MTVVGLELDLPTGWLRVSSGDELIDAIDAIGAVCAGLLERLGPALTTVMRAADAVLARSAPMHEDPPIAVVGAVVVLDPAPVDLADLADSLDIEGIGAAIGDLDGVPLLASAARAPGRAGAPGVLTIAYQVSCPAANVVLVFCAVETAPATRITAEIARVISSARIVRDCDADSAQSATAS